MKTKKIKYEHEYNFELFGISSADDDYTLSWHLSKLLNAEFVRLTDLEIRDDRFQEFQVFSVYECSSINGLSNIRLVSNKANIGFLIEELKNIDFFILIFENEEESFLTSIISMLKSINTVTGVFRLKPESLKSKEKLLF